MAITKPDYSEIWASGGAVVEPSDTKKQTGWTAEVPPHQWFNWLDNRQDSMLAHINERGVPEWDGLTNYLGGALSYTQGSDGVIYKSVAASGPASTVQNPTTDVSKTYWKVAFAGTDNASEGVEGIAKLATTAIAQAGVNDTDIMTALKVKQAIDQFASGTLDTLRINVASAATVNLTTSAPDTRHINITGTTTITQFTIAAGLTYFVRFDAALTLTNNANIVTQTGVNISAASGDTCIIRSTATNTVEVLSYVPAGGWAKSLTATGWQKLPTGLIVQWGKTAALPHNSSLNVTFPISFPNEFFVGYLTSGSAIGSTAIGASIPTNTLSQMTVSHIADNSASSAYFWLAIGY